MQFLKSIFVIVTLSLSSVVNAGFITMKEAELDAIFSQTSIVNSGGAIDIRFGPGQTILAPNLLSINDNSSLISTFNLVNSNSPVINVYYTDSLNYCGGQFNSFYVGCATLSGNDVIVESGFMQNSLGAALLAHELGHNLGLDHVSNSAQLMNSSITGNTLITSSEAAAISASSLVQTDNQTQRFIMINPVAIVAQLTEMTEPSALILMLLGAGFMFRAKRKS